MRGDRGEARCAYTTTVEVITNKLCGDGVSLDVLGRSATLDTPNSIAAKLVLFFIVASSFPGATKATLEASSVNKVWR